MIYAIFASLTKVKFKPNQTQFQIGLLRTSNKMNLIDSNKS
jgi:hypothetical protein